MLTCNIIIGQNPSLILRRIFGGRDTINYRVSAVYFRFACSPADNFKVSCAHLLLSLDSRVRLLFTLGSRVHLLIL